MNDGSMSPWQWSIYTHGLKLSTYGLSTNSLPRHSNYAPLTFHRCDRLYPDFSQALPWLLPQFLHRYQAGISPTPTIRETAQNYPNTFTIYLPDL
jgi:hypothetical protein